MLIKTPQLQLVSIERTLRKASLYNLACLEDQLQGETTEGLSLMYQKITLQQLSKHHKMVLIQTR